MAEEIISVWGEILSTVPHSEHFKGPVFDRVEKFAGMFTVEDDKSDASEVNGESKNGLLNKFKSAAGLKKQTLEFYDKFFMDIENRRAVPRLRLAARNKHNWHNKEFRFVWKMDDNVRQEALSKCGVNK